jgi:hypothetical protein
VTWGEGFPSEQAIPQGRAEPGGNPTLGQPDLHPRGGAGDVPLPPTDYLACQVVWVARWRVLPGHVISRRVGLVSVRR